MFQQTSYSNLSVLSRHSVNVNRAVFLAKSMVPGLIENGNVYYGPSQLREMGYFDTQISAPSYTKT